MPRLPLPRRALARSAVAAALLLAPLPPSAAGVCAPATEPDPVGTTPCPGVRPGAVLRSGSELCTFGFVFQGSDRRRYVATAGHCAYSPDPADDPGRTQTWRAGTGPAVRDGDGKAVGRFAYATMSRQFKDFALVRLDNGVAWSPQLCHFGGPTRLNSEVHNRDIPVHHYGQGVVVGDLAPARTGDALFGLYRADYAYFHGAAYEGDSGAPVVDADGGAIGHITDLTTPFTGNVGVNRLADHVAAAQKALRIRLTLLTAPPL